MSACNSITTAAKPLPSNAPPIAPSRQVFGNRDLLIHVLTYLNPTFVEDRTTGNFGYSTIKYKDPDEGLIKQELHQARLVGVAWHRVVRPSKTEIAEIVRKTQEPKHLSFRSPVIFAQLNSTSGLFITPWSCKVYMKWSVSIDELCTIIKTKAFGLGRTGISGHENCEDAVRFAKLLAGTERARLRRLEVCEDRQHGDIEGDFDNAEKGLLSDKTLADRVASFPELEQLRMRGFNLGPETYSALFSLKNLTDLDIEPQRDIDWMLGAPLPEHAILNLRKLNVSLKSGINQVEALFPRCRSVVQFTLTCSVHQPEDLTEFLANTMRQLPMVEELELGLCAWTSAPLPPRQKEVKFDPCPRLRKLSFGSGQFFYKEDVLNWLEKCNNITELVLSDVGQGSTDRDVAQALRRLSGLKTLSLHSGGAEAIEALFDLQRLNHVVLSRRLTDLFLQAVLKKGQAPDSIQSLSFEFRPHLGDYKRASSSTWRISPEGYKKGIKEYYSDERVRQMGVFFSSFKVLTDLHVEVDVDPTNRRPVCAILHELSQLKKLQKLSLCGRIFPTGPGETLQESVTTRFAGYPALQELELNDVNLSGADYIALVRACPVLQYTRLTDCTTIPEQARQEANEIMKQRRRALAAPTTAAAATTAAKG
jgi:hypothetical protein